MVREYPNNALFHNNLSYAAARVGNMNLANKHIALALQLAPEHAQVLDTYGYIFYLQKKYAKALVYLEKANKKSPRDIGIARNLANCLIKLNRKEEADLLFAALKL
ncbi:MAG: tetratricopeptide repeat protein [Colwellia sp.]|nr:tetratricopeptide repeat protein [Colwellia sp.]